MVAFSPTDLITPLISSAVAAIAIMLSSEIIEHNLEFKHAIIMAVAANFAAFVVTPFIEPFLMAYIPAIVLTGSITLTELVINFIFWIVLSMVIMTQSFWDEKIKIAIYGFVVTQIVMIILPTVLTLLGI